MAIPTTLESLSVTAASNGPAGTDDRSTADDGLRQAYAFIKQGVSLGSNIASASSITPGSAASVFNITGTTTITAIASTNSWDGRIVTLIFAAALTLTHSSNLALPGSVNITTAANDVATFVQTASGAWRCAFYQKANGGALLAGNVTIAAPSSGIAFSAIQFSGISGLQSVSASGNDCVLSLIQNGIIDWQFRNIATTGALSLYAGTRLTQTIGPGGNVTIAAPSSGVALSVAAFSGSLAAVFTAGPVRHQVTTVASLLAAATAGAGAVAFVTDANATTFASIVAGGGANGVPVYSDGTNWRIG
jgi:hypothetical protein